MSKSIAAVGDFARLFKTTKLSQVPKQLGELDVSLEKDFPTHQIIQSLPSTFARRDFGLKSRLPKKLNSKYIVVNDLDNKYQLPNFEKNNGFFLKKLRFKEMGLPIITKQKSDSSSKSSSSSQSQQHTLNPLFPTNNEINLIEKNINLASAVETASASSSTTTTLNNDFAKFLNINNNSNSSLSPQQYRNLSKKLSILRKPFYEWLAKNHPAKITSYELTKELTQFLIENKDSKEIQSILSSNNEIIPKSYFEKLSGTAGLSYNLKGRLSMSPNGIQSSKVIPARFVGSSFSATFAAGGFIGSSSSNVKNAFKGYQVSTDEFGRFTKEIKYPVIPQDAVLDLTNKKLNLSFNTVAQKNARGTNQSSSTLGRRAKPRQQNEQLMESLLSLLNSTKVKN